MIRVIVPFRKDPSIVSLCVKVFLVLQAGKKEIIQSVSWKVFLFRITSENTNWVVELLLKSKWYYSEVSVNIN